MYEQSRSTLISGACQLRRRGNVSAMTLRPFRRFALPLSLTVAPMLSGLASGACSSSSSTSPAASGPVARFASGAGDALPAFMDVPFPSDVYRDASGHLVAPPGVDKVFKQSSQFLTSEMPHMDGFSRAALSMFYIDDLSAPTDDDGNPTGADIDRASLPDSEKACVSDASSVFLVDLEAADAASARLPCRALFHTNTNKKNAPLVAVGPGRGFLLEEGHRYAAVLTSRIKDTSGKKIAASDTFKKLASGASGAAGALAKVSDALAKATTLLAPALAADHAEIVSIAPYTTHSMTKELFAVRESMEDTPVPTLKWDDASMAPMGAARFAAPVGGKVPAGFTASLDAWLGVVDAQNKLPDGSDDPDDTLKARAHDKIAAMGTAVFDAVNYLQVRPDGYETPEHATFARDASGKVIPAPEKPTAKIWVTIAIPTAPMPPEGYPVVIVQHGLSGSRAYVAVLANVFANKGWAVVGIDSVTFGARAPEGIYQADKTTDYAKSGATFNGPDGLADADSQGNRNGSTDLFGGLKNIGAIRDQMRQAALDTTQLVRVVRSASLDLSPLTTGAAAPKLDASRVAYFGDSLGGIQGAIAAAIEPNVKSWTLNVAGGGLLIETAAHGPAISALVTLAALANFGFSQNTMNEAHPMMNLLQLVAEPGDSLIFAPLLVKSPRSVKGVKVAPRNILQFEVIWDELVGNEANEALARAGGWGIATPNVGTNAGVIDFKNLANNPGRMSLPDVAPDASGLIHDTPLPGVTAVVVQVSPAQHGSNFVASRGKRVFALPWAVWDSATPFNHLDVGKEFNVRCPYRELQATATRFFDDGFQGKVPNVSVLKAPVRDFDDDGTPDDVDPAPSDPTVK
jgi:hypothetical protein